MKTALSILIVTLGFVNFAFASDQEIVDSISSQVTQSIPKSRYQLTVDARNGHVTLSGDVATEQDIRKIKDIASNTPGVFSVKDRLTIHASLSGGVDGDSQELCQNVKRNVAGRNQSLNIQCEGGDITITGTVANESAKKNLEQAAWNTPGVRSVRATVSFPKPMTDSEITSAVQNALQREGMNTNSVSFASKNGIVHFSGNVPNHRVIDAMLATTLMVDGVQDVQSTVTIAR